MSTSLAHTFARKKSAWVEKHINNHASKPKINTQPTHLDLKTLNEKWDIKYKKGKQGRIEYSEQPNHSLLLIGEIQSNKLVHKIIGLFLKNKANLLFPNMMNEIASQHALHYSGMTIRGQKTRWGSCSNRKKLNINYKLLLMPKQVTRYVFIHELCHTVEMNHSAKFWQLVEKCDPKYRQHEQYLKEYGGIK
jgi:predicted metal-dependent hydrolase